MKFETPASRSLSILSKNAGLANLKSSAVMVCMGLVDQSVEGTRYLDRAVNLKFGGNCLSGNERCILWNTLHQNLLIVRNIMVISNFSLV